MPAPRKRDQKAPKPASGVDVAQDVDKTFIANLGAALGLHRAWDRAAKVMASAVPPAA